MQKHTDNDYKIFEARPFFRKFMGEKGSNAMIIIKGDEDNVAEWKSSETK